MYSGISPLWTLWYPEFEKRKAKILSYFCIVSLAGSTVVLGSNIIHLATCSGLRYSQCVHTAVPGLKLGHYC